MYSGVYNGYRNYQIHMVSMNKKKSQLFGGLLKVYVSTYLDIIHGNITRWHKPDLSFI